MRDRGRMSITLTLYRIASTVCPRCPRLTLWKREKLGVTGGKPFHVFFMGSPMRREGFPVRLCEISTISFAFADLLRGSKGLKGAPSVHFDLQSRENRTVYSLYKRSQNK